MRIPLETEEKSILFDGLGMALDRQRVKFQAEEESRDDWVDHAQPNACEHEQELTRYGDRDKSCNEGLSDGVSRLLDYD